MIFKLGWATIVTVFTFAIILLDAYTGIGVNKKKYMIWFVDVFTLIQMILYVLRKANTIFIKYDICKGYIQAYASVISSWMSIFDFLYPMILVFWILNYYVISIKINDIIKQKVIKGKYRYYILFNIIYAMSFAKNI